jgi:hypothetical protein
MKTIFALTAVAALVLGAPAALAADEHRDEQHGNSQGQSRPQEQGRQQGQPKAQEQSGPQGQARPQSLPMTQQQP